MTSITGSGINETYVYDGDGKCVKATVGSGPTQTNTVYIGNTYERDNGSTVRKYYYAGGSRIAMRTGGQTYYLSAQSRSAPAAPKLAPHHPASLPPSSSLPARVPDLLRIRPARSANPRP